jgi:hypothetical protein
MPATSEAVKSSAATAERPNPIVLDLGSHKRKAVKRLRAGTGKLLGTAMDSIEELQRVGSIPQGVQPVILIVKEKRRSSSKLLPFLSR